MRTIYSYRARGLAGFIISNTKASCIFFLDRSAAELMIRPGSDQAHDHDQASVAQTCSWLRPGLT